MLPVEGTAVLPYHAHRIACLQQLVQGAVMGAAVFLASSAADYVNGITLAVDGGWLGR